MSDDFYKRGVQYDARHASLTHDVGFYRSIAEEFGGPVLELACGTGRVAIPIARDGLEIVGLDIEEAMLAVAREKAPANAEFLKADMRDFDLGRRFQTIILAFNSLAHLYDREQVERCFRCVQAHLGADGVFVVAMFNPRPDLLARSADEEREISRYDDPESGKEVVVFERAHYDRASQVSTSYWRYVLGDGEDTVESRLRMRIYHPQELQALLHYAGFDTRALYGDFDRAPFASDSPQQVFVVSARTPAG